MEFWAWLYFCGHGTSLKFRQLESAVFDALGYFLLECLVGGCFTCLVALRGGALNFVTLQLVMPLLGALDPKGV